MFWISFFKGYVLDNLFKKVITVSVRIELTTSRLTVGRSNQLSYETTIYIIVCSLSIFIFHNEKKIQIDWDFGHMDVDLR